MNATPDAPDVTVSDAAERSRYEARVDGALAAFADYRPAPDRVTFTHTEVLPGYDGKGIASVLIRGALDDVRSQGKAVVPVCRFVRGFLERHPDYQDLVAAEQPG